VLFKADRAQSIVFRFASRDFATVSAGLLEKFGPASKVSVETLQNRMGASFTSQKYIWIVEGSRLQLDERSGKIDRGSVLLISQESIRNEPDGKAAAGDM
jgi:hypothetical protein